jgi:rRNA maturation endonuclease Nob1
MEENPLSVIKIVLQCHKCYSFIHLQIPALANEKLEYTCIGCGGKFSLIQVKSNTKIVLEVES